MASDQPPTNQDASPKWGPLGSIERRVLGVLVEKAKTTPENYPLSLNALRSGCNQKNNRAPLMALEEEQVEEALETLRQAGAVTLIQGDGRVDKYRHRAYEWLGVEKVELAVMAELLLRGPQTIGELRGRAARMEPIKGLEELRPVLEALQQKGLIMYLTPEGRGAVVTHKLYQDRELDKLRSEFSTGQTSETTQRSTAPTARPQQSVGPAPVSAANEVRPQEASRPVSATNDRLADEVIQLREELASFKRELLDRQSEIESKNEQLRSELDDLRRQLGA